MFVSVRYCQFVVLPSVVLSVFLSFFFFKQKTAYEMRISDWSSDVCSSDLPRLLRIAEAAVHGEVAESLGERRPALERQDDAAHTAVAVVAGTDLGLVHARELGFGEPGDIDLHAGRSEERRGGKRVSVRVDLGGRRIIKKKIQIDRRR